MTHTLLLTAALSCGQAPAGNGLQRQVDAQLRVIHIQAALDRHGEAIRPLIQEYDMLAVRVINLCDRDTIRRLVEWHADPAGMNHLPDVEAFLRAVAVGQTSRIVRWAMEHSQELQDADAFAVFLEAPGDYASGYKSLARETAKRRAAVATATPSAAVGWRPDDTTLRVLVASGSFVLVLLMTRRMRKWREARTPR